MKSEKIRNLFLKFFEDKGHKIVPSSSLIPESDSSVLFTTAGMQQFKLYYIGKRKAESDFGSLNTASVQRCVRTSDIEEVGDERHLTFFEMLGNFSFGGYWKKEAIKYAYEFITSPDWMNLKIDYVSVFGGEEELPSDNESEEVWKKVKGENKENFEIKKFGRADNFWGPTGEEGPCGPTTEIYVNGIEIWNIVFNEYYQSKDKFLKLLEIKGIDTGAGLERLAMVLQGVDNIYETDIFLPLMVEAKKITDDPCSQRIIADHLRASVALITDGILPSNTDRGYILRRLIRRAAMKTNCRMMDFTGWSESVKNVIREEMERFKKTIDRGMKEFEKGADPFVLFTSYGFPIELTAELAKEKGANIDIEKFKMEMKKHQELSRVGAEQKFKGGLADESEQVIKYHTTTHLLHQALHEVLGNKVSQKGSNITAERLRFDFVHPTKMTNEEKKKVEEIVNQKIAEDLPVNKIILPKEEALKTGAYHSFNEKYGDEISIYFIGENLADAFSKEFCGGPHIARTGALGKFKIIKEEAVASGVRRIKAVLG